ncbi:ATP-binding protein [Arcanobacterium hippocoleae]|uniref:Orc1-like AAA ATPase domain-containing protein n=1 Tax=Arcanobacterium hippocoleae TaxID=149017 RepID=A0ABU1T111_9ACTO|nr:ATP-binding protein [Arcanobacterium hippocoleae]MDR6939040.1 hypothetical protein [Arcanobacterium hippocoleae]
MKNPFKPTAGKMPPVLIGRDYAIEEFTDGINDGAGSPGRLIRISGNRGTGKTVLLTELGKIAAQQNWFVIDETAGEGLAERLLEALVGKEKSKRKITDITLPTVNIDPIGIDFGKVSLSPKLLPTTLRDALSKRIADVNRKHHDAGVFLTIDEVQAASTTELRAIATAVQHLIREEKNIAVAFAGLPSSTSRLLHDEVITFLRRAIPLELGAIDLLEVREAFAEVIAANGRTITDAALDLLTAATLGYPFLIQLVGYHVWRRATDDAPIDVNTAKSGIAAAQIRLGQTVHAPAFDDLSDVDKTFLLAMSQDDGPSSMADIAKRMRKDTQYTGMYRARLIDAGVIAQVAYGKVDFAIPYLRAWLREHEASLYLNISQNSEDKFSAEQEQ